MKYHDACINDFILLRQATREELHYYQQYHSDTATRFSYDTSHGARYLPLFHLFPLMRCKTPSHEAANDFPFLYLSLFANRPIWFYMTQFLIVHAYIAPSSCSIYTP